MNYVLIVPFLRKALFICFCFLLQYCKDAWKLEGGASKYSVIFS